MDDNNVVRVNFGHSALSFSNHDGQECSLAFGYVDGEAVAALFVGEQDNPVLLPRDLLEQALAEGWKDGAK